MSTGPSSERPTPNLGNTVGFDQLMQLPGRVDLPPIGTESAHSQRHEVNPAIALNLISEIQATVTLWRDQLRGIVRSLHALQAQGPMVDGWLESSADAVVSPQADATILRHGDTDALMQYIDSLEIAPVPDAINAPAQASPTQASMTTATQYRLCCLDEDGRLRSQPCPPEQMGLVSIAIARYQNYKQLLDKKQALDAKLKAAVDRLSGVRTMLQQEDLI